MGKALRLIFSSSIGLILVLVLYINVKLYYTAEMRVIEADSISYDLLCELRGLRYAIDNHADEDMQQLYPEGYLFLNSLYGLSWSEFAGTVKPGSQLHNEALTEIQKAFNHVNSNQGREIFEESLSLSYGAFYTGWHTYLLGKKLGVEDPDKRNPEEIGLLNQQCEKIAAILPTDNYPESYPRAAWPADATVCVAALSIHDKFFEARYSAIIQNWISHLKQNLDPHQLIPHEVDADSHEILENTRGCTQSLSLVFLWDIDRDFAREQFINYKKHFLDYRIGLPGILEYPKGTTGKGDVDSGPIIFGMGASATIVGLKVMNIYGEYNLNVAMRNGIEAFGIPIKTGERKKYLFGQLPVADAFIAWAHCSESPGSIVKSNASGWRGYFQLYSGILVLSLTSLIWWLLRRK